MSTLGERLKEERERLNLSQSAFAEIGGVQKNAQINYEKNSRSPDAAYLQALASIGVDVLYVITGQRNENTASSPIELSYLRICRALPDQNARLAGNAALIGILSSFGGQLNTMQPSNDHMRLVAQDQASYKEGN